MQRDPVPGCVQVGWMEPECWTDHGGPFLTRHEPERKVCSTHNGRHPWRPVYLLASDEAK